MTLERIEFSTNRPESPAGPGDTVAADLVSALHHYVAHGYPAPGLDIATAYFNVGGYSVIAAGLNDVGPVRLLIGAEPTDAEVRTRRTTLHELRSNDPHPALSEAVDANIQALAEERDLLGFGREPDAAAERLITWLERDDVHVRRLENDFLHGKTYVLRTAQSAALVGSSNLTAAGLTRNRELNVGVFSPTPVSQVQRWFDEQWDLATDFDLAALYRARRVPHHPWHVFLRMLWELYGDALEENTATDNELGLAPFQIDGVARARRILERRAGVIVADEVGLGKTFIAGELIREATIERRQKALVIAPATLRDSTWRPFLKDKNLRADVMSYEELVRDVAAGTFTVQDADEYALVVVDEAHNLRNADTRRAAAMRTVAGGAVPKNLVLLTATPVNNGLSDLRTLIGYISTSDAEFADIGIPSVADYIARAMKVDPDQLTGAALFDLIDAVTVRRTRTFIKEQYPGEVDFPQSELRTVNYKLDAVLPGIFDRVSRALGSDPEEALYDEEGEALTMARYIPSRFLIENGESAQYQVQNAGLLRSALLKRFESSHVAFGKTLGAMIDAHDAFLTALDEGRVLIGDALREWVASDTDDVDDILRGIEDGDALELTRAGLYDVPALRGCVEQDRELLTSLRADVETVMWQDDPKIAALAEQLAEIAADAHLRGIGETDARNRRKVLIFSYYADTVDYLFEALTELIATDDRLADYRLRIVRATGRDADERQSAIEGFAPVTAKHNGDASKLRDGDDRYDIAIATDVLAEGVNLQQAGQIINYDLPWNPMRLVQRHGRIDRIGSPHAKIVLRSFFPDDHLEELLGLERRIQVKLKTAGVAFGTSQVIASVDAVERSMADSEADIARWRAEDDAVIDASATASSEEYRRRLERALHATDTRSSVQALPWGAGTWLTTPGGRPGVAMCVKVADEPRPVFRWVPFEDRLDDVSWSGPRYELLRDGPEFALDRSTLVALQCADPHDPYRTAEPFDERPEELIDAVYRAWEVVRVDVRDEWNRLTDPVEYQPAVPRVMREAAELVLSHGSVLGSETDVLATRLRQNVDTRIVREIRRILRDNDTNATAAVRALRDAADQLGLRMPKPYEPPPEVELDDVRLVSWVAVHRG